jgi:hypothetical protein
MHVPRVPAATATLAARLSNVSVAVLVGANL